MVEPLRKRRLDGVLYRRRRAVEKELRDLEKLDMVGVVARARTPAPCGQNVVSSEALVHILRREVRASNAGGPTAGPIDALTSILTQRCASILARKLARYDEIDREAIAAEVMDHVVDALVEDRELDDYSEVNFNDWLMHNRLDACRKHGRKAARTERLGDAVEDLSDDEAHMVPGDEEAQDNRTPDALYALNAAREQANLPLRIESANLSPEDQYRIADMVGKASLPPRVLDAFLGYHYLEVPIESNDPEQYTLVKHFAKSEKTIRLWIKRAEKTFAKLRESKHESEQDDTSEPGHGAARLSR